MAVVWDAFLFLAGLGLLVVGAEGLVRGATVLAGRLGMTQLTIGLTVVALGTSAPELVVSAVASAAGNTDVVLGSVIGSNILNILIVLGATAIACPVCVRRETLRRDLPLVVLVSAAVFWMAFTGGGIARWEGILLVAAVIPFLVHLHRRERRSRVIEVPDESEIHVAVPGWVSGLAIGAGITLLVIGAQFVVEGGTGVANTLGIPERVIALTLVAIGTSAPELATGLVAAFRKQVDLAVGNIIGSNILNLTIVLGTGATIRALPVPSLTLWVDGTAMVLAAILLMVLVTLSSRLRIGRRAGSVLIASYLAYVVLLLSGTGPFT